MNAVENRDILSKSEYIVHKNDQPDIESAKQQLEKLKDANIKYKINSIFMDFEKFLANIDLSYTVAPFFPNLFHFQRKKAYNAFCDITHTLPFPERQAYFSQFIDRIDVTYIHQFINKIKEPYVNLIFKKHYKIPEQIDVIDVKRSESYQELHGLSNAVANWLIQIELSADLIERATLYELYANNPDEKKSILKQLETDWKVEKKFEITGITKKLFKKVIIMSITRLSGVMVSKGFNYTTISWSACVAIVSYIVGQAAFPWTLVVPQVSIPWILGGFLASKVLDHIGKQISREDLKKDIDQIKDVMDENAATLMEHNKSIAGAIRKCFDSKSQEELTLLRGALRARIDVLLDESETRRTTQGKPPKGLTESKLSLEMLITKESDEEEGWIICDIEEFEEKNEEDFVVCDFKEK